MRGCVWSCVCVRACARNTVRACVHACVRACVSACVRACVSACVRARARWGLRGRAVDACPLAAQRIRSAAPSGAPPDHCRAAGQARCHARTMCVCVCARARVSRVPPCPALCPLWLTRSLAGPRSLAPSAAAAAASSAAIVGAAASLQAEHVPRPAAQAAAAPGVRVPLRGHAAGRAHARLIQAARQQGLAREDQAGLEARVPQGACVRACVCMRASERACASPRSVQGPGAWRATLSGRCVPVRLHQRGCACAIDVHPLTRSAIPVSRVAALVLHVARGRAPRPG